jgi:Uncharacterised nucleotidyltransferase
VIERWDLIMVAHDECATGLRSEPVFYDGLSESHATWQPSPTPRPVTQMSDQRDRAAWSILVEATTVDVVRALTATGLPHIALKGPLLRRRLFPEGDDHNSSDIDVLVAPDVWSEAENELAQLGFEPLLLDIIPGDRPNHARPYARAQGGPSVDLHRTLLGAEAPASVVWSVLEKETETVMLSNTSVTVLNPPGQLLHVALHAAQNGAEDERTLRYLTRCLELSDDAAVEAALRIATAIRAIEAFSLGLSLVTSGRELNRKLGITPHPSVLGSLRATSAPNTAHALEWFATRPDIRTRAVFVWHKIFPPKAYMLSSYPKAGSRVGLLAAYPARWLWLTRQFRPSLRAWRDARRISRRSGPRT